ncbi:MAG TPA: FtsX-like permease family protein [Pedococcus sp.]
MWAAIRYRRVQAAVLVLLAALVTTCAVFAALYERGLEQALLHGALDDALPADTALVVHSGRTSTNPDVVPEDLVPNVPAQTRELYGDPVGMLSNPIELRANPKILPSPTTLVSRTDVCAHLRITTGACPAGAGEVLVSGDDLAKWKWKLGQTLGAGLEVVGAYEVVPDPGYWGRLQLDGKSGVMLTRGSDLVPALDDFVTSPATFGKGRFPEAQATLSFPLRNELISLGNLSQVSAALAAPSTRTAGQGVNGALVQTQLPEVISSIRLGQERVQVIVPLLMAQLGLLAAAILLLVAQAAVDQRRPEVALARLRGRSRDGAGRLVMGELGLTVALGLPLGFVTALGLNELVRRVVLPAGVPFEVPPLAVLGVLAAAVVCALAIWLAVRPVRRLTVSELLRRVAPQRGRAFGVVDLLAVALAVFGLVGLATHSLSGPLALMTPTLVALAAGLVASRLAIPVAGASGRAQLRRGRVGPALTAFGLQRRPAMRKVDTVVGVAVALTVFAANALVVANHNWTTRARVQTGAPVVLDTDARNPVQLLDAVRELDATGARATPVAVIRRTDPNSAPTMAVVARDVGGIAFPMPEQLRLGALAPPDVKTVQLHGNRVTGTVSWQMSSPEADQLVSPSGQSGAPRSPVSPDLDQVGSELRLSVTMPTGERLTRLLMKVPPTGNGSARLDAPLLCPEGCRLDGIEFRKSDLLPTVTGRLRITGFGVDGSSLRIAAPENWNHGPLPGQAPEDKLTQQLAKDDTIDLDLQLQGFALTLGHADVPDVLPGLLAGDIPPGGSEGSFQGVGLNGTPVTIGATQRVEALPALGGRGVLVDYETLARLGGTLSDNGLLSVWLTDTSRAATTKATQALSDAGINVTGRHTFAAEKDRLDHSASAWGLRLAAFTGAMAVLLAAIVVIVMSITGWRVVARDLAALHMAGVPLGTLRRSLVREQVVLVVVGALVGAVCGAVSSSVAMPLVPLFDSHATPVPALDLAPSLLAVVGSAVLGAVVVVLVGVLAAFATGRRIQLRRVREAL